MSVTRREYLDALDKAIDKHPTGPRIPLLRAHRKAVRAMDEKQFEQHQAMVRSALRSECIAALANDPARAAELMIGSAR